MNKIKNEVESAYSEGKLSELHYNLINKKILNLEGKDNKIEPGELDHGKNKIQR